MVRKANRVRCILRTKYLICRKNDAFPLSVTFGDSSPKGRAKSLRAKIIQKRNCTRQFLFYCIEL